LCVVPRPSLPPRATLLPYTTLFRSCWLNPDLRKHLAPRLGQKSLAANVVVFMKWILSMIQPEDAADRETECRIGKASVMPVKKLDRKSTRLNSSHDQISYAVFCLKK